MVFKFTSALATKKEKTRYTIRCSEFLWLRRWDFSLPRLLLCRRPSPRYTRLVRLATRDIASAKTVINRFMPCSPIPFSEGHGRGKSRFAGKKIKPTTRVGFVFWLRRWDLILMTFGLCARRATRLLHSAILVPEAGVEPVREINLTGF